MTRQEYIELQALYEKEGQTVSWNIANVLRGSNYLDKSTLIASAYALLMANSSECDLNSIESFCASIHADTDRQAFLESALGDAWQMVSGQRFRYSGDVLKSIILFYEDRDIRLGADTKTPDSISKVACKLFSFKNGDEVADFGIGNASFISEAYLSNQGLSFYGVEINASVKEIAAIRLEVLGCKCDVAHGNIFNLDSAKSKYQYIFANYPFGLRHREIGFEHHPLLHTISQKVGGFTKSISSDWLFNATIMECLKPNGKGIAIMSNGSTWNTTDRAVRKYFIDNGYLEAVIALPERLFETTNIATTMVILSAGNERTMLVDATSICEKGRRYNSFTEEQVEQISFSVANETINSRFVTREELAENDYVINPTRYLTEEIVVENGEPFENIIKSITRGAPLKASQLDEMVSDEPTDYQYLMLANIQRGQIDSTLPYIKGVQDNQRKYCLKNHDLILSKNGAPFKIAVAEVQPGKTILANGNLYIIEIDEEKADPFFVKAFLESEKGAALLKSITVGAAIPNIGVEALKKLPIPNVPLEEQHELATKYLAKVDEITLYQRKLQKAYEELAHIYDSKE